MSNDRVNAIHKRIADLNCEINSLHRELKRIELQRQFEEKKVAVVKSDRKVWCEQCERLVFRQEIESCQSAFCKAKD